MREHPIEGLMLTAMNSIQDMVDVNTIIGEPIETANDIILIPISKVSFGFAAGGSEFRGETIDEYTKKDTEEAIQYKLPFGGGSGAGVNINPVAFLVVQKDNVKLMPINYTSCVDRLLDYIPEVTEKLNKMFCKENMKCNESNIEEKIKNNNEQIRREEPKKQNNIVNKTKPMKNRAQIKREAQNAYEDSYNVNQGQEELEDIYDDFDE